jgi:hypothetical protein
LEVAYNDVIFVTREEAGAAAGDALTIDGGVFQPPIFVSNSQLLLLIQNVMIDTKRRKIESIVRTTHDKNKSHFTAKDESP